eukprot:5944323-Prymnesium_polylepis.1
MFARFRSGTAKTTEKSANKSQRLFARFAGGVGSERRGARTGRVRLSQSTPSSSAFGLAPSTAAHRRPKSARETGPSTRSARRCGSRHEAVREGARAARRGTQRRWRCGAGAVRRSAGAVGAGGSGSALGASARRAKSVRRRWGKASGAPNACGAPSSSL